MDYSEALTLAEFYLEQVKPICVQAEIVGSVKRQKQTDIHDIEILLIQKPGHPRPVFGRPKNIYTTYLDKLLADLEYQELIRHAADKKDGDKLKKRAIVGVGTLEEFCIEFYIVTPATWALQNVIRTGSAWFSHRFVTNKNAVAWDREKGYHAAGFLPNEFEYKRGKELESGESCIRTRETAEIVPLEHEWEAIELVFGKWIEPKDRSDYAMNGSSQN